MSAEELLHNSSSTVLVIPEPTRFSYLYRAGASIWYSQCDSAKKQNLYSTVQFLSAYLVSYSVISHSNKKLPRNMQFGHCSLLYSATAMAGRQCADSFPSKFHDHKFTASIWAQVYMKS
jgi:hypothetical protein